MKITNLHQPKIKKHIEYFLISCFSLLYGIVLSNIPNSDFYDFDNYLTYAESSQLLLLKAFNDGIFKLLFNEPIWLLTNSILNIFFSNEEVVRLIILFSASITSFIVLKNNPKNIIPLVIFLILPGILKNYLIHLRQGFAIAIFLLGFFSKNRNLKAIFIISSPLIHSSFFFILMIMQLSLIMKRIRLSDKFQTIIFLITGILVSLSLSIVSKLLGARQADEYNFSTVDGSGLAFIFWTILLIVWISSGNKKLYSTNFEIGIISFYISSYWLIEVSSRIFESGLILVLIRGLFLPKKQKIIFIAMITTLSLFTWLIRFDSYLLGFGKM